MDKKNNYKKGVLVISGNLVLISSFLIGYSNWLEVTSLIESGAVVKTPVCYINDTYYTSIGKAISDSKSGDTIYVIPGNTNVNNEDYTITSIDGTSTLIIPEGVTLSIPYEEGVANSSKASNTNLTHALDYPAKTPKSLVTLKDNITLINNGTIEIGGLISAGSGGHQTSYTSDKYSALLLGDNSTLINHGTLNIYGLLGECSKDNGSLIVSSIEENSSTMPQINVPFYWYDFAGGSALKAIYDDVNDKKCIPLDDFYVENITPKIKFCYGTSLNGWVNIYAASNYGNYTLSLVSTNNNSVITLNDKNSYFIADFDEETLISQLDFYGDTTFNALDINVKEAITNTAGEPAWIIAALAGIPSEVTSTSGYFPLTYHFDISLNSFEDGSFANYNGSNNSYKLMNGGNFFVNKNAKLTCDSFVVYDGTDYYTGRGTHASSMQKSILKTDDNLKTKSANCIVNGELNVNLGAGIFETSNVGSILCVNDTGNTIMYEPKSGEGSNTGAKMNEWYEIPLTLSLVDINGQLTNNNEIGRYKGEFSEFYYWNKQSTNYITGITIDTQNGIKETDEGKGGEFNLVVSFAPQNYDPPQRINYNWTVDRNTGASFSDTGTQLSNLSNPTLIVEANDTEENITYTVTLNLEAIYSDETIRFTGSTKITAKSDGCFNENSIVITDSGEKPIKSLLITDKVLSYNHFNGKFEYKKLIGLFKHFETIYVEETLYFENSISIVFLTGHDLFDCNVNKYVHIDEKSIKKFIGHDFLIFNKTSGSLDKVKLKSYKIDYKFEFAYTLITESNLNAVVDSFITLTPFDPSIANVYDYDENHNIDKIKLENDIKKYGLFSFDEWNGIVSEYMFDAYNAKYLKIGIGKGQFSINDLQNLISYHNGLISDGEMTAPSGIKIHD